MVFQDSGAGSLSAIWLAGLPSCLQRVRLELHVRCFGMRQTCSTCGEQVCSTGLLQKAGEWPSACYQVLRDTELVAQAGLLEAGQPLMAFSLVLVTPAAALWPQHTILLLWVNPGVLSLQRTVGMSWKPIEREKYTGCVGLQCSKDRAWCCPYSMEVDKTIHYNCIFFYPVPAKPCQ